MERDIALSISRILHQCDRPLQALDTRDIFLEQLIKNFNPKRIEKPTRLDSGAALPLDEAVSILQRNERGRQARQVARVKLINKKQRQLADRRNRTGVALTHEMAVTKIQSALRGMLWRRRIRAQADAVRCSSCTSAIRCIHVQVLSVRQISALL